MSEFKVTNGPKGRKLYFKTNEEGKFKMVSYKNIPKDVLATIDVGDTADDTAPEFRKCIFCGVPGTEQRRINNRLVDLCFDDYQSKTTGETAEKVRESIAVPPKETENTDKENNNEETPKEDDDV